MDETILTLRIEARKAIETGRVSVAYKAALKTVEERAVFENNKHLSIICEKTAAAVTDGNADELYHGRRNTLNEFTLLLKKAKVVSR